MHSRNICLFHFSLFWGWVPFPFSCPLCPSPFDSHEGISFSGFFHLICVFSLAFIQKSPSEYFLKGMLLRVLEQKSTSDSYLGSRHDMREGIKNIKGRNHSAPFPPLLAPSSFHPAHPEHTAQTARLCTTGSKARAALLLFTGFQPIQSLYLHHQNLTPHP